ncbi:MAG: hypothetical protein JST00_07410 [Deltaproteobacteria bacterium]|nr:hypothetical protein [Deltaproteobacteria bacterium]
MSTADAGASTTAATGAVVPSTSATTSATRAADAGATTAAIASAISAAVSKRSAGIVSSARETIASRHAASGRCALGESKRPVTIWTSISTPSPERMRSPVRSSHMTAPTAKTSVRRSQSPASCSGAR